jgi:NADPH-dependent 2,4-dienoyl-CoA reductase/sulfur reductase-like enzyme
MTISLKKGAFVICFTEIIGELCKTKNREMEGREGRMKTHYDLIIIGAGTVGFDGLRQARALGAEVLLVEKEKVGGTCINWG